VDSFSEKEKIKFENAIEAVKVINDENSQIEVVVANGNTYKVRKDAAVIEEKQEKKSGKKYKIVADLKVLAQKIDAKKVPDVTKKELEAVSPEEVYAGNIRADIHYFVKNGGLPVQKDGKDNPQVWSRFENLVNEISAADNKIRFVVYNDKTYKIVEDKKDKKASEKVEKVVPAKVESAKSVEQIKKVETKVEKEKSAEELFKEAEAESLGVFSIKLFQSWMDGYRTIASEEDAEKQIQLNIEKALFRLKGKEGEEFEKVVQYTLNKLK